MAGKGSTLNVPGYHRLRNIDSRSLAPYLGALDFGCIPSSITI